MFGEAVSDIEFCHAFSGIGAIFVVPLKNMAYKAS